MYRAKDEQVQSQQLKVQELVIREADTHLYSESGGAVLIDLGQDVAACVCAVLLDNSAAAVDRATGALVVPRADISVSGEVITLASTALDANDVLIVKYIVA